MFEFNLKFLTILAEGICSTKNSKSPCDDSCKLKETCEMLVFDYIQENSSMQILARKKLKKS